jgi:hypothetical protein
MPSEAAGSTPVQRTSSTHYCIIRQDLPAGTFAAQLIHAAGESATGVESGTFAVALAARDEAHLEFIEAKLRRLSIPHHSIREPDAPWFGALMAIGLEPVTDRSLTKKVTKGLKLIK